MSDLRRDLGTSGERMAAAYLSERGIKPVAFQVRTPFGEIDLVCLQGDEVVFVEVKTRRSDTYGYPEEAVTPAKVRHIVRSAESFLSERCWNDRRWRVDVVAIRMQGAEPDIVHFPAIDIPEGI